MYNDGTYELRSFCPVHGVNEDPANGSGAGSVGVFFALNNPSIISSDFVHLLFNQGKILGRNALIRVAIKLSANGLYDIHVGGGSKICISGTAEI